LTIRLFIQSLANTLDDEAIENVTGDVLSTLGANFGAALR